MSDEIAKRLQQARAAAGFKTASEAARRFGWNENTYRSHENGERGLKRTIAYKYAAAFGVSPVYLLMDLRSEALDFSGTWRPLAGQLDDTGSTNIKTLPPTTSTSKNVAIFDIDIIRKVVVVEFIGPREYGIFTKGDLLVFAYDTKGWGEVGQYCLIKMPDGRFVVRFLKLGPDEGSIDLAQRAIDPPEIITPLWLGPLYLVIQRNRWDKDDMKEFVNRATEPETY